MSAQTSIIPRRSCLYMPGSNARAIEKAKSLPCDAVILDLEDAVAPEGKAEARERVAQSILDGGFGHREVIVRINGFDTDWGEADLAAVAPANPDAILVPKVQSADDIRHADARIKAASDSPIDLWVMIEMPLAILRIEAIAAASETTTLAAFVMGTNDLAKELQAVPTPDRLAFQSSLMASLLAARAYGLAAIDGVFNDIANTDGFLAESTQGQQMGFDGKTLIHPSQIDPCNEVFTPHSTDVEQARAVIAAFAAPENAGQGVIKVNGNMTELLHLEQATRLVTIAEEIAKRS